jgi:hypothetical protein
VTAAYHHHEMADERRRALQYLADQVDRLAMAGSAPPVSSHDLPGPTAVAPIGRLSLADRNDLARRRG